MKKTKKTKHKPKFPLPADWKSIVLYNCQGEEPNYGCEITKDSAGRFIEPVWVEGIGAFDSDGDWIASVTLIDGTIAGLEDVKVGEQLGYAIKNRLWV